MIRRPARLARRASVLVALVAGLLVQTVPALADPAGPTNYRSSLTSVPEVDGVSIEVFGGDAFLVIQVDPGAGREVLVYGYDHTDEVPDLYLRFSSDGTVEANRRSTSTWKNQDRYQAVEVPDSVDPSAPPDWELVATDGRYAWHDHRIHWMSTALPPTIDPDGGVQVVPTLADWRVPIQVDGVPAEIAGTLRWEPAPHALPWVAVGLLVLGIAVALGRSRPSVVAVMLAAASALAIAVALGGTVGVPPGVGLVPARLVLPVVALGATAIAHRRGGEQVGLLLAVAGLPLLGWVLLEAGALTNPIVPSAFPVAGIRLAVVACAGAAVGAIVAGVATLFGGSLESLADLADGPGPD